MSVHSQGRDAVAAARPNAGLDVSKEHLDAAWADRSERFSNDAEGWDALAAKLQADGVDIVALEASGGYERSVACALQLAGLSVVVLNARQARDFAKAMGQLAKTDEVDAAVLQQFAAVIARHPQRQRYIRALHGHALGDAAQPGDPRVSRPADRQGQAAEGRHRGVHAQAADDPQCHPA